MKKIEFKTAINASKKKVWETMLQKDTYEEWVNAAWPDSSMEGEWKEGETLRFTGKDQSGTMALLVKCTPYDYILAKHIALLLAGGMEDHDSKAAKDWVGTTESYTFSENNGITELKVELNINPVYEKMFSDDWPKALAKLKEICER